MSSVLQVVASLGIGGAERVAVEVARGLQRRGWMSRVVVLGKRQAGASVHADASSGDSDSIGVPVDFVDFDGFNRASLFSMAKLLRRVKPDLVHVHNRPYDWQLSVLCRTLHIPVVYTVHGPRNAQRIRVRALYGVAGRCAGRVVCVSKTVAEMVRRHEWAASRRVTVIYNGVDTERFRPLAESDRYAQRAALGWKATDFIWITACRLTAVKGLTHLIEAMRHLPGQSRSRLVIAGDGDLRSTLQGQVDALGVQGRVSLLGSRSDVERLLASADGFANSSLTEGHPLAVLEAASCGTQVLGPRLDSMLELAAEGFPHFYGPDCGRCATSHDPTQIAEAMLRVEQAGSPGPEARLAVRRLVERRFSQDTMLSEHERLYAEVLGGGA